MHARRPASSLIRGYALDVAEKDTSSTQVDETVGLVNTCRDTAMLDSGPEDEVIARAFCPGRPWLRGEQARPWTSQPLMCLTRGQVKGILDEKGKLDGSTMDLYGLLVQVRACRCLSLASSRAPGCTRAFRSCMQYTYGNPPSTNEQCSRAFPNCCMCVAPPQCLRAGKELGG